MMIHKPATALLADLGPANAETLRILQNQAGFADNLESLLGRWQPQCVVHGDIRLDNILVRPRRVGHDSEGIELWVTDWEMIQFGDPAWDLAGALQDLLVFWVSTMPLTGELTTEQMIAQARVPLSVMRTGARAMWRGYREAAGLSAGEEHDLLGRAVAFSAARTGPVGFRSLRCARPASWAVRFASCKSARTCLSTPSSPQTELYGIPAGSLL